MTADLLSGRDDCGVVLDSDFLVVTGAFKCADNGLAGTIRDFVSAADAFASVLAEGFAAEAAETTTDELAAGMTVALFDTLFDALLDDFSVFGFGLAAPAAACALLEGSAGVFTGIFIAFAIGSTINNSQKLSRLQTRCCQ